MTFKKIIQVLSFFIFFVYFQVRTEGGGGHQHESSGSKFLANLTIFSHLVGKI